MTSTNQDSGTGKKIPVGVSLDPQTVARLEAIRRLGSMHSVSEAARFVFDVGLDEAARQLEERLKATEQLARVG